MGVDQQTGSREESGALEHERIVTRPRDRVAREQVTMGCVGMDGRGSRIGSDSV